MATFTGTADDGQPTGITRVTASLLKSLLAVCRGARRRFPSSLRFLAIPLISLTSVPLAHSQDETAPIVVAEDNGGLVDIVRPACFPPSIPCQPSSSFLSSFGGGDALAVGDVVGDDRGDGRDDIVVTENDGGQIDIFAQTGSFLRSFRSSFGVGDALAVGDVDGDGRDDIVISEDDGGVIDIYLDPSSCPPPRNRCSPSRSFRSNFNRGDALAVGDVSGDGQEDIVVARDDGGLVDIYFEPFGCPLSPRELCSPSTSFRSNFGQNGRISGKALAVGDIFGDGQDDIVISGAATLIEIYSCPPPAPASATRCPMISLIDTFGSNFVRGDALAVGDINLDGRDDIVIANDTVGGPIEFYFDPLVCPPVIGRGPCTPSRTFGSNFNRGDRFAVGVPADTDRDGILNLWERNGIDANGDGRIDLDLPALMARPDHKNIFVEFDFMACFAGGDCGAGDPHGHFPQPATIQTLVQAFKTAPVSNPDGMSGIDLHIEISDALPHQQVCAFDATCFDRIKSTRFGDRGTRQAKELVFHYGLGVHDQAAGIATSGRAEIFGNDFMVSLGSCWGAQVASGAFGFTTPCNRVGFPMCPAPPMANCLPTGTVAEQTGTFMHELGHNLGLDHGGGDNINCKPNYLSVMNYTFQLWGLQPGSIFTYSSGELPLLIEGNLNETIGIQDGPFMTFFGPPANLDAIDQGGDGNFMDDLFPGQGTGNINWDSDFFPLEPGGVIADINNLTPVASNCPPSPGEFLTGFDDWNNLKLSFRQSRDFADGVHATAFELEELDAETAKNLMESLPIDIDPGIPPAFELISYQDSGYRFQIIPLDADPPAGFEQLGFVDAAFDMGSAAFGSGGTCPLQTTVQSNWPANSQLLVRRLVSIPAGMGNIRILISVDNDIVDVFFNGTPITDPISHDECPVLDEFRLDVPPSLVQPGENLVAFHLLDRGVESFFNARILAGLLPGDLNADGDVDANDVALLLADRNTRVENSRCGPLCDLDSDGRITPRDAGLLRRQCTRPGCAVE